MKKVQVRHSGDSSLWQDMDNTFGSAWEIANAPEYPLDVNIIASDSESVRHTPHARRSPCSMPSGASMQRLQHLWEALLSAADSGSYVVSGASVYIS